MAVILIFSLSLALVPGVAMANEVATKTIRVGYVDNYSIYEDENTEKLTGYGYEYFQEIAKYTGWAYEFVKVEWSEGMEMLEEGKLDIFGPMQKNKERQELFEFPDLAMGYEYGALWTSEENKGIRYKDVESFNGMKVGIEKGNFYNLKMNEYCVNNGITVDYVYMKGSDFLTGVEDGTIDAFVVGSLMDIPGAVVVEKIATEPYYCTTAKGNEEVLNGLNKALYAILKNNAYYAATLDKKYYGDKSISMPTFTKEELEYIKENPALTVVGDPNWAPIEYVEDATGKYKGIIIDALYEIEKITGFKFNIVTTDSYNTSKQMIRAGTADLLLGYTEQSKKMDVKYTDGILEIPISLVGFKSVNMYDNLSVAMPNLNSRTSVKLMQQYPNFSYVDYGDSKKTIDALKSGREDLAFVNAYAFDELVRSTGSNDYIAISTNIKFPVGIGVAGKEDPIVGQILNKAITHITPEQVSAIVFSNTVNRAYSVPIDKLIKDNSLLIIVTLLLFFFAVLYIIRRNNKKLMNIAYKDELTGISTLRRFKLDLADNLRGALANEYILVSLDIDNFKYINDSFGYVAGDQVLVSLANHFRDHLGSTDEIARVNADTFVFYSKNLSTVELKENENQMNHIDDHIEGILPDHYKVKLSMGVYNIENTYENISVMIDKANIARKSVKENLNEKVAEYTEDMDLKMEWKKAVTMAMECALIDQQFEVFLQPKYQLTTNKIVGAEALVRWNHPLRGLLAPIEFIPIFEQNGFITKIDMYVLKKVCALLQGWQSEVEGLRDLVISVNLSRLHLHNPNLVEELIAMTRQYNVETSSIEIELTESIMVEDHELLFQVLNAIRTAGFTLSVDDFGSGYSSLNMLKDLSIDILKIDKGFLENTADVKKGRDIIGCVTNLARQLQIITVAEGVETQEQAEFLRELGCDIAQGYYYAKPMPIAEFEQLVLKTANACES